MGEKIGIGQKIFSRVIKKERSCSDQHFQETLSVEN